MAEAEGPARPEVGVIALVPDRWNDPWMPRHHVMRRLACHFHVAWLDPPPHWRKAWPAVWRHPPGVHRAEPGFRVVRAGALLPSFHRPEGLARGVLQARARWGARTLRRRGCRHLVLYVWRHGFLPALDAHPWDLVCYHIDDEYTFSEQDRPIPEPERALLVAADRVFIHSPALLRKKGDLNPRTTFVPNGVDYSLYSRAYPEPSDLRSVPRPRIGYAGWLKKQLDWFLLETLAERHPEWSFVFVGGHAPHHRIEAPIRRLRERPNAYFLGGKESEELARYPGHFDVCLMPYEVNDYTRYIYPLKLHEYLATGRPVVGTPIETLREFSDVLQLPVGAEAWSRAIEAALSNDDPEARRRRIAVARRHDWDRLVSRIAGVIEEDLARNSRPDCTSPRPTQRYP